MCSFIEGLVDFSLTENRVPKWMVVEGVSIDGYVNENSGKKEPNTNGFSVSPGTTPNTKGILLWSEPFIIRGKDGRDLCLLIMDTQGLWDYDTSNEFNVCIFGLSAVLSSFLIFNSKECVNAEQLKSFSTLLEFSEGVVSHLKIFQQLDFLIRDFPDYDTDANDRMMANEYNKEQLELLETSSQTKTVINSIKSCFNHFNVFCLPKPGDIDGPNYDGSIEKINPLFMRVLSDYIVRIVENVQPRRINGEELTVESFAQ